MPVDKYESLVDRYQELCNTHGMLLSHWAHIANQIEEYLDDTQHEMRDRDSTEFLNKILKQMKGKK